MVVLNVYNEVDHIQSVIRSFGNKVEKILVIDGAYAYYPYKHHPEHDKCYSTDGSLNAIGEIMQDFVDTEIEFVSVEKPWEGEVAKKNYAIKNYPLTEGDYYFFVDGHELLEGDFATQRKVIEEEKWEIGRVIVYNPAYIKKAEIIDSFHYEAWGQWRILQWDSELELKKRHWNFFVKGCSLDRLAKKASPAVKTGVCEHIKLAHFSRNTQREVVRDLHKKEFGKFHWIEPAYISWRKREGKEDGTI